MTASTTLNVSQLVASIPAMLGYYPHDSIVVVMLNENGRGTHDVGPVIRADTGDTNALYELTDVTAHFGADLLLAFAITPEPDDSDLDVLVDAGVSAIWQTSAVSEDEPLTLLHRSPALRLGDNLTASASVAPVHATATTRRLLAAGGHIHASRADAVASYSFTPELLTDGQRQSAAAWCELMTGDTSADEDLVSLLDAVAGWLAVEDTPEAFADALPDDAELLGAVTTCLSPDDLRARDLLIGVALAHPSLARVTLIFIARTSHDNAVRANALAVLAIIDMSTTQADSSVILRLARETDPHNRLAQLLDDAVVSNCQSTILPAIIAGVEQAREKLDLPNA